MSRKVRIESKVLNLHFVRVQTHDSSTFRQGHRFEALFTETGEQTFLVNNKDDVNFEALDHEVQNLFINVHVVEGREVDDAATSICVVLWRVAGAEVGTAVVELVGDPQVDLLLQLGDNVFEEVEVVRVERRVPVEVGQDAVPGVLVVRSGRDTAWQEHFVVSHVKLHHYRPPSTLDCVV